jgi:tetratricopeptide (TPR) repeat protein
LSIAAEKKAKRPAAAKPLPLSVGVVINDANVLDQFKAAEDQSKRGKTDDALRVFQGIYDYTRDALALMKCVKGAYDKAVSGQNLEQDQREDLYLKLQRIAALTAQYGRLKGESAYQIGAIYAKKGNAEQARKYLLETCQTAPFSLDPASPWMRSKNLLLGLSSLEGEF